MLAGVILRRLTLQAQLPSNLSSGGLCPGGRSHRQNLAGHGGAGRGAARMELQTTRIIGNAAVARLAASSTHSGYGYDGYYAEPDIIQREVPVPMPPPPQIAAPEPQRIPTPPR